MYLYTILCTYDSLVQNKSIFCKHATPENVYEQRKHYDDKD